MNQTIKNLGIFGAGGVVAWLINELNHKDAGRRYRMRIITSMGVVYAMFVSFNNIIPKFMDNYFDYLKMKTRQEFIIDSTYGKKDYKQALELQQETINEHYTTLDKKIDDTYSDMKNDITSVIAKGNSQISYTGNEIKQVNNKLDNISNSIAEIKNNPQKPVDNALKPVFTSNDKLNNTQKYEDYLIVIDKSQNLLNLLDNNGDLVYACDVICASNGGPDNGSYSIASIADRSGDLYPGVMKLNKSPLVITGSGENSEYNPYIQDRMNVNKTGIRTYNNDYNNLESMIKGKSVKVLVQD
ncbi:TPA: hypothetical protein HA235_04760 [Candidatus Woesearchaeota archaeon]|nr:hypothetical protein [Candidatus Woesearchaeota archaeon]HIH54765.1 hypothetical protein [Candidatus Woesearchaeota archaeon]HIJ01948.1 hypothetical protein [Candidatus Woesearchaeota archaeon]HIJ14762.1 hypothetical protein [Candidatus Woesearchaeota archaeon]